jgi:nucleoside-diphosphate-sugar epimerase
MECIIIIGGSGFIGTHYSKKLISEGCTVLCIDIVPPRFEDESLIYIKQDVRYLKSFETKYTIKKIYNFAAIHTTPGHPVHEYYETNIAGAVGVCEFAERHNIEEIIFTSSISTYGPNEEEKNENAVLTPNTAYGYSKMLAEQIHTAWFRRKIDRKLTIVRPAVVFGPGEGGNFTRLAKMMRKGIMVYPGRKDTIKACIYVEDLIYAIELARESSNNFELLNGTYEEKYTLEDIVETFRADHFPSVKVFMLPKGVVLMIAKLLKIFNFLNIGIHPERVMKLIISTNISSNWFAINKVTLPGDLRSALNRWSISTDKRFD